MTLDPRTAGQSLRVSPGLNSVHITPGPSQELEQSLDVPANPERFHPYSCILAREGFDSGVHFWDIEVFICVLEPEQSNNDSYLVNIGLENKGSTHSGSDCLKMFGGFLPKMCIVP